MRIELPGNLAVVEEQVQLVVDREREVVEVGAADRGPHAVDDHRLSGDEVGFGGAEEHHGADDVLGAARVHAELNSAIADCGWVVGASARLRTITVPIGPRVEFV